MMIAAGALWIQRRLEASVGVGGDSDDGRRKLHGNNRSGNWRARAGAGYEAEVVGRTMTTTLTTGPRESGGGKICGEASGRPVFKSKLWTTVSLAAILFATLASTGVLFKATEARYIHSTYRFSPGELGGGDQPLASSNGYHAPAELSRRQDDDGEADNNDGDEDDDDQRAAASYRNQDDNGGAGGGEGGNGGDNYGDNESDGPYEETPVEQEGQADLERFFDDHLGASDRDGMDKENLPTNLVSLLSEPPGLANFNAHNTRLPVDQMLGANSQPLSTLTVVPLAPVMNPTVHPREEDAILRNHIDPMSSLPTIQTSFIRLPGEKMVITHQVTARSSSDPVSSSSSSSSPPPPKPLKFTTDDDDETYRRSSWHLAGGGENQGSPLSQLAAIVGAGVGGDGWQLGSSPFITGQQQQLRISPTESLTPSTTTTTARTGNSAPTWSNDAFSNAATGASSNRIVATEDDDFGRVYVTNETNRPFKIDALGGFDPEEDFMDAAKELEVVPTDRHSSRTTRDRPDSQASSTRGLKRRSNQQQRQSPPQPSNDGGGGDDRTGDNASGPGYTNDEQQQRHNNNNDNNNRQDQEQASSERGGTVPPGQEISFNDPDTDMMYEDASETDEVTFGQDDPYQTDLEAEMRQQEYEKLLARRGPQQTNYQPSTSGSLNVVVDNGGEGGGGSEGADGGSGGARGDREGAGADNDEEDDMDADLDSRYDHDEPATTSSRRQRESMTAAAAALEPSRRSGIGNSRRQQVRSSDIDDEGGWVNDGVDEMDIPSQSHQNSVLEKAEKHDEAVRRAAAADEKAEVAAAEADKQRDPDGGGGNDGSSAESGQTNDNGEENLRMPNADYLKNDFVEDDSGYAA